MGKKKTGKDIKCKNCGTVFYVPLCYLHIRKNCSIKCSAKSSSLERKKENNPNWKGLNGKRAYDNIHTYARRHWGIPNKCENLLCKGNSNNFEWANITAVYNYEKENYRMLCRSCHIDFDVYKKPIEISYEKDSKFIKKKNTKQPKIWTVRTGIRE